MNKINDGGAAFPTSHSPDYPHEMVGGLSIRDYFAAKAMSEINWSEDHSINSVRATMCYHIADAMLKARETV